jgi:hypothetical protein
LFISRGEVDSSCLALLLFKLFTFIFKLFPGTPLLLLLLLLILVLLFYGGIVPEFLASFIFYKTFSISPKIG